MSPRPGLARVPFALVALLVPAAPLAAQTAHEDQALHPADAAATDEFGVALDLSGTRLAVGAHLDDGAAPDAGSVYLYSLAPDGSWNLEVELFASDAADSDAFGLALSLSGERLLVGAWRDDDKGMNSGSAYLFERTGGQWVETTKFVPSSGVGAAEFGKSVDLDGDRAVVGASFDSVGGSASGAAYVYERQASGAWVEVAKLEASDEASFDRFGSAVAIDGDRALVGAVNESPGGLFGAGSAYLFERQAGGAWVEVAKLVAPDAASGDGFGYAVALDGERALVTARQDDDGVANSGSVSVFERAGGAWVRTAKLLPSQQESGAEFGLALALEGDRALVAAPLEDANATNDGALYLFERRADGTWQELVRLSSSESGDGGSFGRGVALDLGRAAASGPGIDTPFDNAGGAYLMGGPSLFHGAPAVSLSAGGSQTLYLRAGAAHAGELYLFLGSFSGTSPGIADPVSGFVLPLNYDPYLELLLLNLGAGVVAPGFGLLDPQGAAQSAFVVPAGTDPSLAGAVVHHAFVTVDPAGGGLTSISPPARVELVP